MAPRKFVSCKSNAVEVFGSCGVVILEVIRKRSAFSRFGGAHVPATLGSQGLCLGKWAKGWAPGDQVGFMTPGREGMAAVPQGEARGRRCQWLPSAQSCLQSGRAIPRMGSWREQQVA